MRLRTVLFLIVLTIAFSSPSVSTTPSLSSLPLLLTGHPNIFPTQSLETYIACAHETSGVDIAVSAERVILLDCQVRL